MSDLLFSRVTSRRGLRFRLAAAAAAMLLVFTAFSAWVGLRYLGYTGAGVNATAKLVALGDSLGVSSNVKYRGLRVGRVVSVSQEPDRNGQYSANVVIEPGYAGKVPSTVKARVLPSTLFGAEYIDLEPAPATRDRPAGLTRGATIAADTSAKSVRVMDTFNALYRVMHAIDPSTLNLGISQLADALRGRGQQLRHDIGTANSLLASYTAAEPTFYSDLDYVSKNLTTLASVEPDLAATLRNILPVAGTITHKKAAIDRVMRSSTGLAGDVDAFLKANTANLAKLLAGVAPVYRAFVTGDPAFESMLALTPLVLERGTSNIANGAITMLARFAVAFKDPYTSADCPRYGAVAGSNC